MVLLSALILIWVPLGFGLLGYTETYTSVSWRYWQMLGLMRQFANTVGLAALMLLFLALSGRPLRATLDEVGAGATGGDDRDGNDRS